MTGSGTSPFARPAQRSGTSWRDTTSDIAASAAAAPETGRRLVVDRIRCDGFGMCAELLPELIELDDWGYPIISDDRSPTSSSTTPGAPSPSARSSRFAWVPMPRATMPNAPAHAPTGARRGG